jgi:hypothetical protein
MNGNFCNAESGVLSGEWFVGVFWRSVGKQPAKTAAGVGNEAGRQRVMGGTEATPPYELW